MLIRKFSANAIEDVKSIPLIELPNQGLVIFHEDQQNKCIYLNGMESQERGSGFGTQVMRYLIHLSFNKDFDGCIELEAARSSHIFHLYMGMIPEDDLYITKYFIPTLLDVLKENIGNKYPDTSCFNIVKMKMSSAGKMRWSNAIKENIAFELFDDFAPLKTFMNEQQKEMLNKILIEHSFKLMPKNLMEGFGLKLFSGMTNLWSFRHDNPKMTSEEPKLYSIMYR